MCAAGLSPETMNPPSRRPTREYEGCGSLIVSVVSARMICAIYTPVGLRSGRSPDDLSKHMVTGISERPSSIVVSVAKSAESGKDELGAVCGASYP